MNSDCETRKLSSHEVSQQLFFPANTFQFGMYCCSGAIHKARLVKDGTYRNRNVSDSNGFLIQQGWPSGLLPSLRGHGPTSNIVFPNTFTIHSLHKVSIETYSRVLIIFRNVCVVGRHSAKDTYASKRSFWDIKAQIAPFLSPKNQLFFVVYFKHSWE